MDGGFRVVVCWLHILWYGNIALVIEYELDFEKSIC
jgi:hypothetical protein